MVLYPLYAAGQFISTGNELMVTDKFTGVPFAQTCLANEETLERCIQKARLALPVLAQLPAYERYEKLMKVAGVIRSEREQLALLLSRESAKPLRYALTEVDRAAQTFVVAAEEAKRLPGETISLDWTTAGRDKTGRVKYFPVGIVAGISPFNFPMNLAVHKVAPALAAGCPIILKPASATPLSMLEVARIIDGVGFPEGSLSVLPMSRQLGEHLVKHPDIAFMSFTGSPDVGWHLKTQSGKKKVTLELGGNAAAIITRHVDLNAIMADCITGAFAYSGQICIHTQRFIVHHEVMDEFISGMLQAVQILKSGSPKEITTDVSVMIDEANAIRVENWINEALALGARLLCGGTREGAYVAPTILTNVPACAKVYAEEVFGPVICIEAYNGTISDAIAKVNNSRFGLQASVYTDSVIELNTCFEELQVGSVIHNAITTTRFDHMPYGGIKDSGLGREGVKYAMYDMLEPKLLVTPF